MLINAIAICRPFSRLSLRRIEYQYLGSSSALILALDRRSALLESCAEPLRLCALAVAQHAQAMHSAGEGTKPRTSRNSLQVHSLWRHGVMEPSTPEPPEPGLASAPIILDFP